jgi:hypothetical protein
VNVAVVAIVVLAADPVLELPGRDGPFRLRVVATTGDPEAAWAAFLDRLFHHFDRDRNGRLDAAEAARVIRLPTPRGEATFDVTKLGAGRDKFRAFWRSAGFGPVSVVRGGPDPVLARAGAALFRGLDTDGDGVLSAAELRASAGVIDLFDDDGDERLTVEEAAGTAAVPVAAAGVGVSTDKADAVLELGRDDPKVTGGLRVEASRVVGPGGRWELLIGASVPAGDLSEAAALCRTQFVTATEGRAALPLAETEGDPALGLVGAVGAAADRDGDGRLTTAERDAYLALLSAGASCQRLVVLADEGRNLFALLDADGDRRLTIRELTAASRRVPAGVRAGDLPAVVRLAAGSGTTAKSFANLPLVVKPTVVPRRAVPAVDAPAWFRAADRNGDGLLSPREFPGPRDVFARLDADGDGVLDPAEAVRAYSPKRAVGPGAGVR